MMLSHEDTSSANRALTSQTSHLSTLIHLVVLQNSKLHLLVDMLHLLGGLVLLLLMLLASSTQTKHQVKSRFLLNVVIRKSATVLQLLSSKDQTLLIWGNSLLILNLGLHILNGIRRLNIESDGLSSKSLYEDLHSTTTELKRSSGFPTLYSVEKSENKERCNVDQ